MWHFGKLVNFPYGSSGGTYSLLPWGTPKPQARFRVWGFVRQRGLGVDDAFVLSSEFQRHSREDSVLLALVKGFNLSYHNEEPILFFL